MRRADARLNASIITSSSIRCSFTGGHVGWMMKTSSPAHVLVDLDVHLAVGEARDVGVAQRHVQVLGDLLRQGPVRVAGEELQLVRPWSPVSLDCVALFFVVSARLACRLRLARPLLLFISARLALRLRLARPLRRRGWGGRNRTSIAGAKAPSPTTERRPSVLTCARIAGPECVRTAQQAQPARFTRRRIWRAWSSERAMPNTVGPLPDMIAPSAPAARSAAFMRPITGSTGSTTPSRLFVSAAATLLAFACPQRLDHPLRARRLGPPARRDAPVHLPRGQRHARIHQHERVAPAPCSAARAAHRAPWPAPARRPGRTARPSRAPPPAPSSARGASGASRAG